MKEKHKHLKKHIDLQSQANHVDNIFFPDKNLHILEDGARSTCRYIEHVIV